MINKGTRLDLIWKEVTKCDVLCANCHREFHAGHWKYPL